MYISTLTYTISPESDLKRGLNISLKQKIWYLFLATYEQTPVHSFFCS